MTGSEIRQTMISAREEYIGIIRDELLGPGSEFSLPDREHELISSTPYQSLFRWYSVPTRKCCKPG